MVPNPLDPMEFEVEAALEEELAEEEEDEEELDDDATRLVEARRAADMLLLELPELDPLELAFDFEAFDVTLALTVVELEELPESRPNPERLPRIWGLKRDAKFSAAVTPVSRKVACTVPTRTGAVRTAAAAGAACWAALRRATIQYVAAPAITSRSRIYGHRRPG